jgi:hypothetical protein
MIGWCCEESTMKTGVALVFIALGVLAPSQAAMAKGCFKGAILGGIAGHYAGHHGVLGAVGGCLYGRHLSSENQRAPKRNSSDHYGRGWL